ncbi:MAG: helix-turn-helix domain-containing protein [Coriobacteriales bacterium]|jgi:excisionase family DNA binding protein
MARQAYVAESPVLTTREAASIANVSEKSIRNWCESGEIQAARLGKVWRVNRREFLKKLGIDEEVIDHE